jgi:hypothetical protein
VRKARLVETDANPGAIRWKTVGGKPGVARRSGRLPWAPVSHKRDSVSKRIGAEMLGRATVITSDDHVESVHPRHEERCGSAHLH